MEKTKRNPNFELLRIVAMLMVISLHYLGKGGLLILPHEEGYLPVNTTLAQFLEALAYPATNLYVMITGYFCVKSSFKIERIVKIWIQVFTYSFGIFLIMLLIGRITIGDISDIYQFALYALPITSRHYWFATFYLVFYLISPFLGKMITKLSQTAHFTLMIVLIVLFSKLIPNVVYTAYSWDDTGAGIAWFVVLFVISSYISLYVPEDNKKLKYICVPVVCAILSVANLWIFTFISEKTGKLVGLVSRPYNYNSLLTLISSVAIFMFFRNLKIKEGAFANVVRFVSPLTFGIYLIHEHDLVRGFWNEIMCVSWHGDKPYMLIHFAVSVALVFVVCAIIELGRKTVTDLIFKIPPIKFLMNKLSKVDRFFNAERED